MVIGRHKRIQCHGPAMSNTPSSEPSQEASIAGSKRRCKHAWSANLTHSQREPAFAGKRGDDPCKDAAHRPLQELAAQFERTAAELAQLQGMPPDKVASVLDAARAHMMQEVFGEREAALQQQAPSPPSPVQQQPQTSAVAPEAQVWSPWTVQGSRETAGINRAGRSSWQLAPLGGEPE